MDKGIEIPTWNPPPFWKDETVFIIGGGPSLKDMDWSGHTDRHFIGCNDAYCLGNWVDICIWGDWGWFKTFHWKDWVDSPSGSHWGLKKYSGIMVSNCWRHREEIHKLAPHVKLFKRKKSGLGFPPHLAWNLNTGCAALNLAVILGARRIVLLGFDCDHLKIKETNWHYNLKNPTRLPVVVKKNFIGGFERMKKELMGHDPGIEVINANPDSKLLAFPKMKRKDAMEL